MTEEEIMDEWVKDAPINESDLAGSARAIPILHTKYYPEYYRAKKKLAYMKIGLKKLKHDKEEFLCNPTQEDLDKGWEYPDRKLLKNDIRPFLEGEEDILKAEVKIAAQTELVEMLNDILRQISNRNFIITNMIKDRDFLHGG